MNHETDLVKLLSYPWRVTAKEDAHYMYNFYNWVVKVLIKKELKTYVFYFKSLPNIEGHDSLDTAKNNFDLLRVEENAPMDQILSSIHDRVSNWKK